MDEHVAVAVGVPGGTLARSDGGGLIRRAGQFHVVGAAHYALWARALAAPKVGDLRLWGTAVPLAQVDQLLAELVEDHLLATVGRGEDEARAFLRTHRLHLVGYAIGNSQERPDVFRLAGHDLVTRAELDGQLYGIVLASNRDQPLWELCVQVAGEVHPDLASCVLNGVVSLLKGGVVVVDST